MSCRLCTPLQDVTLWRERHPFYLLGEVTVGLVSGPAWNLAQVMTSIL